MDFYSLKLLIDSKDIANSSLERLGYQMKAEEFEDFSILIDGLTTEGEMSVKDLMHSTNDFYFGYNIPQLGKEFDLIRIGSNYNLNIEIKNNSNYEKQVKQIESNKYYLHFMEQPTILYSFDIATKCFLKLNLVEGSTEISMTDFSSLKNDLLNQVTHDLNQNIDSLFEPRNYLISPFNDTDEFIKKQYLLTPQQETIVNQIEKDINSFKYNSYAIEGRAGTGKSLLLYHLAFHLKESYPENSVLVVHSGSKNNGHYKIQQQGQLKIIETKEIMNHNKLNEYSWIFIDEAQRIYENQLMHLIELNREYKTNLLFFFDVNQTFEENDNGKKNKQIIIDFLKEKGKHFKLTNKIRSNKEMAKFISQLISYNKNNVEPIDNLPKKIDIKYVNSMNDLKGVRKRLETEGFELLGYTPSKYKNDIFSVYKYLPLPHDVIGQDIDKVAVIIDSNFMYKTDQNKIKYYLDYKRGNAYYSGRKMLYQNLTRVRDELKVIIVDNPQVFEIVSSLLKKV